MFNPEGSFQQNVSPARATFEFPLGSSNLLGGQIFRKMAGITDKFNFNYANFSKLHSPRLDETSFMNPIKNCYDLGYMGLNHQKTYFANNPDSRQGSFSNLPKMSKLPGHEEEALRESIEQMRSSDENVKSTESKSNSTQLFSQSTMKLVNSSSLSFISDAYKINGECKLLNEQLSGFKRLKIPRLTDFQLYPSFTSKFSQNWVKTENQEKSDAVLKHEIKEPEQNLTAGYKYKCTSGAEINDFSFNVTCVQKVSVKDDTMEVTQSLPNTDSINDFNSAEDGTFVGHLSKKQRDLKVKKYIEKKKKRKWDKKVNYESRKKVADTRPRYKGRFVSFEQAGELLDEYKKELEKRLSRERVFITQIFSRKTKELRKTIFPTQESFNKYTSNNLI